MGDQDKRDESDPFPSTRWSLVARAAHPDVRVQREALAELLERYMPAIRQYLIGSCRVREQQADDLLQQFLVSKVLEEDLLSRADQHRGRFRAFLVTSIRRFVISQHRQDAALKRTPQQAGSLDDVAEPSAAVPDPKQSFDAAWARQLLDQALAQMEAECRRAGREDIWGVFAHRVLTEITGSGPVLNYEELVVRFGLHSPAHASNILITGKRMFARVLRSLVAEYEPDETRIDAEIAELRDILARARA